PPGRGHQRRPPRQSHLRADPTPTSAPPSTHLPDNRDTVTPVPSSAPKRVSIRPQGAPDTGQTSHSSGGREKARDGRGRTTGEIPAGELGNTPIPFSLSSGQTFRKGDNRASLRFLLQLQDPLKSRIVPDRDQVGVKTRVVEIPVPQRVGL